MRRVYMHTGILRVIGMRVWNGHRGIHCTLRIPQSHHFALRVSLRCHLGCFRSTALPKGRESLANMGKVPVRLKVVVYTLSPYHQQVMAGLWKDVPYKLGKKFHENWVSAFTLVVPIMGTYMYAENYREKDKLHHRY